MASGQTVPTTPVCDLPLSSPEDVQLLSLYFGCGYGASFETVEA
jgi:hypothetical protein